MKYFALLVLTAMVTACASHHHDRQIASEEQKDLQQIEKRGDFGPGYRH